MSEAITKWSPASQVYHFTHQTYIVEDVVWGVGPEIFWESCVDAVEERATVHYRSIRCFVVLDCLTYMNFRKYCPFPVITERDFSL